MSVFLRDFFEFHDFHLAAAAFFAISDRFLGDSLSARAFAPALPLFVRADFLLS